jgi:hypothetical protein
MNQGSAMEKKRDRGEEREVQDCDRDNGKVKKNRKRRRERLH